MIPSSQSEEPFGEFRLNGRSGGEEAIHRDTERPRSVGPTCSWAFRRYPLGAGDRPVHTEIASIARSSRLILKFLFSSEEGAKQRSRLSSQTWFIAPASVALLGWDPSDRVGRRLKSSDGLQVQPGATFFGPAIARLLVLRLPGPCAGEILDRADPICRESA